ncbi:MAG: glycosyltransferase family 2 protein [Comamonadaceae bacterium]|nr:MAG: glycosyltransferase family 2 protein [Comamonadaceae bacterium]
MPNLLHPPLTVSIVSHGQLELVLPLLAQLARWCGPHIARVVLTCNIPEPALPEGAAHGLPVERIDNPTPMGFGANHNQAFGRCATPWFLVLNPDIRLDADVLGPMLAAADPASGLLTPRIQEPGKPALEPHRALITPFEILARRRPGYAAPAVPHWIPGLFMLFRASAYAQVGGFDERFFMYGEDFDLCARLQLAGWRLQVAESLVAVHDARRASHASGQHLRWHLGSLVRVWLSPVFWRFRRSLLRRQRRDAHLPTR